MRRFLPCLLLASVALLARSPETIRVISFNDRTQGADAEDALLGNEWRQRLPLVRDMLKDLDPDLIGIQEATGHQVQGISTNFEVVRKEELAILFRPDRLEKRESGFLKLGVFGSPDPWGDRWLLWVRLRSKASKREFLALVTHLSTAADQVPQARQVLDFARELNLKTKLPTCLLGDFNFNVASLLPEYGFVDAMKDKAGTFHAFMGGRQGERIDFIAIKQFEPRESGVDARSRPGPKGPIFASDHHTLWMDVQ